MIGTILSVVALALTTLAMPAAAGSKKAWCAFSVNFSPSTLKPIPPTPCEVSIDEDIANISLGVLQFTFNQYEREKIFSVTETKKGLDFETADYTMRLYWSNPD